MKKGMLASTVTSCLPPLEILPADTDAVDLRRTHTQKDLDCAEAKVVANALGLLHVDDTHKEACRKVSSCLAEAFGLNIRSRVLDI